jgi:hypothetical protein
MFPYRCHANTLLAAKFNGLYKRLETTEYTEYTEFSFVFFRVFSGYKKFMSFP